MNKNENYKKIYELTEKFLLDNLPVGIGKKELNIYLKNNKSFSSLNDIFIRMAVSLQNYQAMPNIIKFEKNFWVFNKILYDFDVNKILEIYDENSLYEQFCNNFKIANPESKTNSWLKFTKGIISGAIFLSKFNNHIEFDEYVKSFCVNEERLLELPNIIKSQIYGFGFALSCDFLKELGYNFYPKPDVHLMDIFVSLRLSKKEPYDTYKKIIEMAKVLDKTPYEVDKVFWLICSGKYYLHNITNKPLKQELIKYLLKQ